MDSPKPIIFILLPCTLARSIHILSPFSVRVRMKAEGLGMWKACKMTVESAVSLRQCCWAQPVAQASPRVVLISCTFSETGEVPTYNIQLQYGIKIIFPLTGRHCPSPVRPLPSSGRHPESPSNSWCWRWIKLKKSLRERIDLGDITVLAIPGPFCMVSWSVLQCFVVFHYVSEEYQIYLICFQSSIKFSHY